MRLINKILRYKFTEEEKQSLIRAWIVNGCWWKWGFNFTDFLQDNVKYLPNFIKDNKFIEDVSEICIEHDFDYHSKIWFYLANYYFARWIYYLTNWTTFWHRVILSIVIFFLLNKYWKKYYKGSN